MLFNSYIFILAFLPLTVSGFYLLSRLSPKASRWYLTVMSLWFYGSFNFKFLAVLAGSIFFNFLVSKGMTLENQKRKLLLITGISVNILLLGYYKYTNFFIDNLNLLFGTNYNLLKILFPIGISYITLQQIAFLVDSYKGECRNITVDEYILFVVYFPHIISGPILLQEEFIPQIRNQEIGKWNADNFARGIQQFVFGLSKKVLIADKLAPLVDYAYTFYHFETSAELLLALISYTFQLYFDFSGYCDMATGVSHMLNIDLPINFDSPYKSASFGEFWRRWHVSLGRFFRKYVYIPLGGNRKGRLILIRNTMIVFLLSGFWHGANLTFVLWGALHGMLVFLGRLFEKGLKQIPVVLRQVCTFAVTMFLWGLFRADSIAQYGGIIKKIVALPQEGFQGSFAGVNHFMGSEKILQIFLKNITRLQSDILLYMMLLLFSFVLCMSTENNYRRSFRLSNLTVVFRVGMLFLSLLSLSNIETFIYGSF